MSGKEAWAKEKELAQKALALDPNLAEAHLSLGMALFTRSIGGLRKGTRSCRGTESQAGPGLRPIWVDFTALGRFDEAIANEQKALNWIRYPLFNTDLGFFLLLGAPIR